MSGPASEERRCCAGGWPRSGCKAGGPGLEVRENEGAPGLDFETWVYDGPINPSPTDKKPGYDASMPNSLVRYQQTGDLHFVIFTCFRRQPRLGRATAGGLCEHSLETMRLSYHLQFHSCTGPAGPPRPQGARKQLSRKQRESPNTPPRPMHPPIRFKPYGSYKIAASTPARRPYPLKDLQA